jgi:hypothetical protein
VGRRSVQGSGSTRHTYDRQGRPLRQVRQYDDTNDGTVDYRETIVHTYDARGVVVETVRESDWSGSKSRETTISTHDRRGNILTQVVESDWKYDIGKR